MDFTELMRLAGGHVEARLTQTALELAIFDALESSAATAEAVANRLKLEPMATELLLNSLASLELLRKQRGIFFSDRSRGKISAQEFTAISRRYDPFRIVAVELLGETPRGHSLRSTGSSPEHVPRRSHGNRDLHQSNGLSGQGARRRGSGGERY